MRKLKESPSQTAGPYVHIGCVPSFAGLEGAARRTDPGAQMIIANPTGQRITLAVQVIDGNDEALKDAMIEIWQPGPDGSFGPTPGFSHWGRQAIDPATGMAVFHTLKPGHTVDQAPHILLWIAARGINTALTTRVYFPDEDNSGDRLLSLAADRAETLVATPVEGGYRHTVRLQGENETVFFNV